VRVNGNQLVDASGRVLQIRGVNASALEFVAIQGWSPTDPWGGQKPNFSAIAGWKANAVRIPLNEASWLGYQCVNASGATENPDPGANYKQTVKAAVSAANAAGLYVVLDLHWSAPNNASGVPVCPLAQNPMADADHSIAFWTDIAKTFQSNPSVVFELFNEPYFYWLPAGADQWKTLKSGGVNTQYVTGGSPYTVTLNWQSAGMQQMLDAIRATGARNVVLAGGVDWNNDMTGFLANAPIDSIGQLGAAWHTYPGEAHSDLSVNGPTIKAIAAVMPVVVTETGDPCAPGTVGSPYVSQLLPFADTNGLSYMGWTWDVWGDPANVLIKDASGTPTDGYGVYFKSHLSSYPSFLVAIRKFFGI